MKAASTHILPCPLCKVPMPVGHSWHYWYVGDQQRYACQLCEEAYTQHGVPGVEARAASYAEQCRGDVTVAPMDQD